MAKLRNALTNSDKVREQASSKDRAIPEPRGARHSIQKTKQPRMPSGLFEIYAYLISSFIGSRPLEASA
jgi:hypothetical protein